jgi:hypothetical protein
VIISKLPPRLAPVVLPTLQDPQVSRAVLVLEDEQHLRLQALPPTQAAERDSAKEAAALVRDFVLPVLAAAWPDGRPVVNGVLAVWAGHDAWKVLQDPNTDSLGKKIALSRMGIGVINAGLSFMPSAGVPQAVASAVASSGIGLADKLHRDRQKASQQAALSGGFLVETSMGTFVLTAKTLQTAQQVPQAPQGQAAQAAAAPPIVGPKSNA